MAYTTRNAFLGVCLVSILTGSATAQISPKLNDRSALPVPTAEPLPYGFTEATPVLPGLSQVPIDSAIFYEDFRDSLDGWKFDLVTPNDVRIWEYEKVADLKADNGEARFKVFDSPTVGNGFLWFDYIKYTDGKGLNTTTPYFDAKQTAISPAFDMRQAVNTQSYALYWHNYDARLNVNEDWSVRLRIGDDEATEVVIWQPATTSGRPDEISPKQQFATIPKAFIGKDSVKILFEYDGDYYGWAIDDIFVGKAPGIDLKLDPTFIGGAPNAITPVEQTKDQKIYFITDVSQLATDSVNAKLAVTLEKIDGTTATRIYTDTLDYGKIYPGTLFENVPFPKSAPMPTEIGSYRGTYLLVSDSDEDDADASNNTAVFNFRVGKGLFAKALSAQNSFAYGPAVQKDQTFGNIYLTPVNTADNQVRIDSVRIGFGLTGLSDDNDFTSIEITTYGWRGDINKDTMPNFGTADTSDFVPLGVNYVEFAAKSPNFSGFRKVAADETKGSVFLPLDRGFIGFAVAMRYRETSAPGTLPNTFRWFTGAPSYGGRSVVTDERDIFNGSSSFLLLPQSPFAGYNGFGGGGYFINADITMSADIVGVSNALPEAAFSVSPNPASTQIAVEFDFGSQAQTVDFTITNAVGQRVNGFKRDVASGGRFAMDVSSLNVGLYYITATTADGKVGTKRVLIQR